MEITPAVIIAVDGWEGGEPAGHLLGLCSNTGLLQGDNGGGVRTSALGFDSVVALLHNTPKDLSLSLSVRFEENGPLSSAFLLGGDGGVGEWFTWESFAFDLGR